MLPRSLARRSLLLMDGQCRPMAHRFSLALIEYTRRTSLAAVPISFRRCLSHACKPFGPVAIYQRRRLCEGNHVLDAGPGRGTDGVREGRHGRFREYTGVKCGSSARFFYTILSRPIMTTTYLGRLFRQQSPHCLPFSPSRELQRGLSLGVLHINIGTVLEKKSRHLKQPKA